MKDRFRFRQAGTGLALSLVAWLSSESYGQPIVAQKAYANGQVVFVTSTSTPTKYTDTGSSLYGNGNAGMTRSTTGFWSDDEDCLAVPIQCSVSGEISWDPLFPRSTAYFPNNYCGAFPTNSGLNAIPDGGTPCHPTPPCPNGNPGSVRSGGNVNGSGDTDTSTCAIGVFAIESREVQEIDEVCVQRFQTNTGRSCGRIVHEWNVIDVNELDPFLAQTSISITVDGYSDLARNAVDCSVSNPVRRSVASNTTVQVTGPDNYQKVFTFRARLAVSTGSPRSQMILEVPQDIGTVTNDVWNFNDGFVSFGDPLLGGGVVISDSGEDECGSSEDGIARFGSFGSVGASSTFNMYLRVPVEGVWTIDVQSSQLVAARDYSGSGEDLSECTPEGTSPLCAGTGSEPTENPDGNIAYDDLLRIGASIESETGSCRYIPSIDTDDNGEISFAEAYAAVCSDMADYNGDGFTDFFDYGDFVSDFELGVNCRADVNQDGFLDFFDFDLFAFAFGEEADACDFVVVPGCNTVQ